MIEKSSIIFLLFVLLSTNSIFAAKNLDASTNQDTISLSTSISTDNVKIYSEDTSLYTPDTENPTEKVNLYVVNGAFVYDINKIVLAKIVYLKKPDEPVYKKDKKLEIKKTIALKKKRRVIETKASKVFLANTHSSQNVFCGVTSEILFCLANSNNFLKSEIIFQYRHLNVQTYSYLEKNYTDEFSLSSEFSEYYFSRPPPII